MESMMDIMGLALKGDSVERLSSQMHESQSATRKGLESALPLSMAGLASQFSSEQKASELLGTLKGGDFPHVEASELGSLVRDPAATHRLTQSSSGFLGRLFGGKLDGILDSLAGTSGVSRSSATTLLGIAAPIVLGALQRESQSRSLDARGLSRLLSEEGRKASGLLPSGLSALFGRTEEAAKAHGQKVFYSERAFETHAYDTPEIVPPAPVPPPLPGEVRRTPELTRRTAVAPERRSSGLWWLLLPIALFGLFSLMRMGRDRPERPVRTVVTAPPSLPVAPTSLPVAPPTELQRPEAVQRPQVEEAIEVREAVQTPPAPSVHAVAPVAPVAEPPAPAAEPVAARLEPETRVVHFETSSSRPLNRPVLHQVVATLTQHPEAKVRLRGYADPRGDQVMNQELSESRANAVREYLMSHGIAAERIEMVGRGVANPQNTNAGSRRVEVIIER
ncbi:MAG: DUF937 domain-containing protein [Myxococcales bacterium]